MRRDELILAKTMGLACSSSYVKICGKQVRVAASIYVGNNLIAQNVNKNKSHPVQKYYNKYVPFDRPCNLHAEVATIIDAVKRANKDDLKKSTIYIARKLNSCGYGTARPCAACMQAIRDAGIRRIVYTTDSGYAVETVTSR